MHLEFYLVRRGRQPADPSLSRERGKLRGAWHGRQRVTFTRARAHARAKGRAGPGSRPPPRAANELGAWRRGYELADLAHTVSDDKQKLADAAFAVVSKQ
jgi:hypothetical protein